MRLFSRPSETKMEKQFVLITQLFKITG
ncbi:hypothetical protein LINPERHAP2_LOCUS36101 [Linum perenne]